MSDLLDQDAILSETVLKLCSDCGHARGEHSKDGRCKTRGCECATFES